MRLVQIRAVTELFEVAPDASVEDISKRRRELNRKYHPDQFQHDPQMQVRRPTSWQACFHRVVGGGGGK